MDKREQFKVKLDPDLIARVMEVVEARGTNKTEFTARIFAWFAEQPAVIQQSVLRQMPEDVAPDVARLLLERMAGEVSGKRNGDRRGKRSA